MKEIFKQSGVFFFILLLFCTLFIFGISWGYSFVLAICCFLCGYIILVFLKKEETSISKVKQEYANTIREIVSQQPVASDLVSTLFPLRNENTSYSYLINPNSNENILNYLQNNESEKTQMKTFTNSLIDQYFNSPTQYIKDRII